MNSIHQKISQIDILYDVFSYIENNHDEQLIKEVVETSACYRQLSL